MESSQALDVFKPPFRPSDSQNKSMGAQGKLRLALKRLLSQAGPAGIRVTDLGGIIKSPTQRARWVKALTAKLENLNSTPETYMSPGDN